MKSRHENRAGAKGVSKDARKQGKNAPRNRSKGSDDKVTVLGQGMDSRGVLGGKSKTRKNVIPCGRCENGWKALGGGFVRCHGMCECAGIIFSNKRVVEFCTAAKARGRRTA